MVIVYRSLLRTMTPNSAVFQVLVIEGMVTRSLFIQSNQLHLLLTIEYNNLKNYKLMQNIIFYLVFSQISCMLTLQ